jgi:hypothetical protein
VLPPELPPPDPLSDPPPETPLDPPPLELSPVKPGLVGEEPHASVVSAAVKNPIVRPKRECIDIPSG